jgi:hypothetical protein
MYDDIYIYLSYLFAKLRQILLVSALYPVEANFIFFFTVTADLATCRRLVAYQWVTKWKVPVILR